jgi:hypothetical protein
MVGVVDVPDADGMTAAPSRSSAVAFHLGGAVLSAVATAAAAFAGFLVSFGTSTCNDPDVSDELRALRLGLAVVTVVWALVPAGWAALARRSRFAWVPWAALAGVVVVVGLAAVSVAEVGTFCF